MTPNKSVCVYSVKTSHTCHIKIKETYFFFGLLYSAACTSDYIWSNSCRGIIQRLSQYLPQGTEQNHGNLSQVSRCPCSSSNLTPPNTSLEPAFSNKTCKREYVNMCQTYAKDLGFVPRTSPSVLQRRTQNFSSPPPGPLNIVKKRGSKLQQRRTQLFDR